MVRCAACGFENREAARFCKNCGRPLSVGGSLAGNITGNVAASAAQATSPTPEQPRADPAAQTPLVALPAVEAPDAADGPTDVEPPPDERHAEAQTVVYSTGDEATLDDDPFPYRPRSELIEPVAASQVAESVPESERSPDVVVEGEVGEEDAAAADSGDEASAFQAPPAARPGDSEGPRRPLARGTLIADRYRIVGVDAYDDEPTIYTVEDRGICPSCGARVAASEEEPFCPECGANLLGEVASRKIFELREIEWDADDEPDGDDSDHAILTWHGRRFEPVKPVAIGVDTEEDERDGATVAEFKAGVNLVVGQRSDVGMARAGRPDEDSVFALTMTGIYDTAAGPTFGLYIVCDGMGGHGDGEIASRIAAKTISTYLIQTILLPLLHGAELKPDAVTANVSAAVQLANRHVVDDSVLRSNDMGTTLTMAVVINRAIYVANVGDSRTYLWNEKGLNRLTEDHSSVFRMVQEGVLPEEAIYTHPARYQINRSLGMAGSVEVDHFHAELTPGSVLVLCCDGLWEVLRNDGIEDVLMLGLNDPQTICDTMIRQANELGGPDNISVIVVRAEA